LRAWPSIIFSRMKKSMRRAGSKGKEPQGAKREQKPAKSDKVLGITEDGVRILKPKGKATHFSAKELQAAIASARAIRSSR